MTDQIYYKVQYPMKKAISLIKDIDPDSIQSYDFTEQERKKLKEFLNNWNQKSRSELQSLIKRLRKE